MKTLSRGFSLPLCSTEEGKQLEGSQSVQVINGFIVIVQWKRDRIGSKMGGGGSTFLVVPKLLLHEFHGCSYCCYWCYHHHDCDFTAFASICFLIK